MFEHLEIQLGNLNNYIANGDWRPILSWLREKIHQNGMLYRPAELIQVATGNRPSPEPFLKYLEQKYGELYKL